MDKPLISLKDLDDLLCKYKVADLEDLERRLRYVVIMPHQEKEKMDLERRYLEQIAEKDKRISELEDKDWFEATIKQLEEQNGKLIEERDNLKQQVVGKDNRITELKQHVEKAEHERHEEWITGKEWKWECDRLRRQLESIDRDKIKLLTKFKEYARKQIKDIYSEYEKKYQEELFYGYSEKIDSYRKMIREINKIIREVKSSGKNL